MEYKLISVVGDLGIFQDRPGKAAKFVVGTVDELKRGSNVVGHTLKESIKVFPTRERAQVFAEEEVARREQDPDQ